MKPKERRADLRNGNPQTPVDTVFEYLDSAVTEVYPTLGFLLHEPTSPCFLLKE